MKKSFWVLMILAILVVVFSVQNANLVPFRLFIWTGDVSLAILLISTFIVGSIFGAFYYGITFRKNKKSNIAKDIAFEKEEEIADE